MAVDDLKNEYHLTPNGRATEQPFSSAEPTKNLPSALIESLR